MRPINISTALKSCLVYFTLTSLSFAGAWSLETDSSHLNYLTIKKNVIGENNSFNNISGHISENGEAKIEIDLSSVNTGIDIRDHRLKEMFFKVANFPKAVISAEIDIEEITAMGTGEIGTFDLTAELSLSGISNEIDTEVLVTKISDNAYKVDTKEMIIIDTNDYELFDELEILRTTASLNSITPIIPVSFSLVFRK